MADIFVSYAREDRPHVQRLAADLEKHGWTVWWDRHIHAGKHYDEVIQRELDLAKAVIVLWSVNSVLSRWVKTEASEGFSRDILVPLQVDGSPVPLAFRHVQSIRFDGPRLEPGTQGFDDLIASLTELVGSPKPRAAQAAPPEPIDLPRVETPPDTSVPLERDLSFELPDDSTPWWPGRARWLAMPAVLAVLIAGGYVSYGRQAAQPQQNPQQASAPAPTGPTQQPNQPAAPEPSQPSPQSQPVHPDAVAASGPALTSETAAMDVATQDLQDFVVAFLKAWGGGDIDQLLPFYAPAVEYFDKGSIDHAVIREDRQLYARRWPRVKLELDGPVMSQPERDGFRLRYSTRYEVSSSARDAKGQGTTESSVLVIGAPGAFKIAAHKEGVKSGPF